jgi:hypothetical protein
MSKIVDLTGKRFGRLIITKKAFSKNGRMFWNCLCSCGTEKAINGKDLRHGSVNSCGCLRREVTSTKFKTHGETETKLYAVWITMIQRCEKPTSEKSRKNYKDRGITVYPEWHSFEAFRDWAFTNGYSEGLSIDRMDNNRGYYPDNCRWVNNKTQTNNKCNNVNITFDGITQTIAQWADSLGMAYNVLHNRLKYLGWSVEKSLTTPVGG